MGKQKVKPPPFVVTKREYYKTAIPPGIDLVDFTDTLLQGENGANEWFIDAAQTVIYIHVMNGNRGAAARLEAISEADFKAAQKLHERT